MRVKLDDVALESRETYKGTQKGLPIVGLEHIEPEDVNLTKWDMGIENTFSKMFRTGQVLFGRRRAYLKKAAVAPCDGICSGDITVIVAKSDKLVPELLPFIIQNDRFFDFAIEKSAGSLSPRAKWEHLRGFEFDLPSMEEQHSLAEVLWAFDDAKQAYKRLLKQTDELVKSRFVEMFGDPVENPMRWKVESIGNLTTNIVAGESLNGEARPKLPGEKAVLKVSAVTYGYFKSDEYKVLVDPHDIKKNVYPRMGDLLFSRANTREMVGATALIEQDYPDLILPDKLWRLLFNDRVIAIYIKFALSARSIRAALSEMATGTSGSMYNISMEKLRNIILPVPPLELQNRFAAFAGAADKSKFVAWELNKIAARAANIVLNSLNACLKYSQEERNDV